MATDPALADLTATETARVLAKGEASAVEVATACLDRIAAADGDLRAWTHVDRKGALRAAEDLDRHRKRGLPLGPLHGVPVGVKDIIDVAGMPCENGTPLDAGRVPRHDAEVVRRLRQAGAVILGKTATTEFAFFNPAPTTNPHDPARTPGGSSAGSAAAVAAGMVPLALGTQTNGSVVRPASFCGVFGYKPSFGAVPRTGIFPFAQSTDHVGVMARSLDDLSLLEVLAGGDGQDPDAVPHGMPLGAVAGTEPPVRPAFAFFPGPTWDQAEDGTEEAFEELISAIPGHTPRIASPGPLAEVTRQLRILMAAEGAHNFGHYLERDAAQVSPVARELVEEGRGVAAPDYLAARALRGRLAAVLNDLLGEFDALITPAAPGEAPARETTGNAAFCSLWSFTGLPTVTLPLLVGPNGLPMGVQLVGAMGDDARLLRTARWLLRTVSEGETP